MASLDELKTRLHGKGPASLATETIETTPTVAGSRRKWTEDDYIRRGIDRTPRENVTVRIDNKAKLLRLATESRVTVSAFLETLIASLEEN